MWGSDQAASMEINGFARLVRDIRDIEQSLGDGVKRVYESELGPRRKLRRVAGQTGSCSDPNSVATTAPAGHRRQVR